MSFIKREEVVEIVEKAITNKETLIITYQHTGGDQDTVTRRKAPFDIGTTNPLKVESNKNNLYAFCYDHLDKEMGLSKPMVHPINIEHIVSIEKDGETFDENELANIHMSNTNYDYRTCEFHLLPERGWFK